MKQKLTIAAVIVAALAFAFAPAREPIINAKILAVTSATAGTEQTMTFATSTEGMWQVEITGTATCILKGRIDPTAPWVTLASRTASGGDVVPVFPYMQAECTAYSSGNVNAWIATKSY